MAGPAEVALQPARWRQAVPWIFAALAVGTVAAGVAFWGSTRPGREPVSRPTGHIVYGLNGTLYAAGFDVDRLELTSDLVPLQDQVTLEPLGASFEFSRNGSLIHLPGAPSQGYRLVWANRDGTEEPLPFSFLTALLGTDGAARIEMAPGAASIAVTMTADGQDDIWNYNVADDTLEPVTTHPADARSPLWTRDGQELVFSSNRDGGEWGLFLKRANGTGNATPVLAREGVTRLRASSWSRDGTTLVFDERTAATGWDILMLPLDGESTPRVRIQTLDNEQEPAVSPDGRWIAYVSDRSGQREVYVDRFPNTGQPERISRDSGRNPRWSADGRELTF